MATLEVNGVRLHVVDEGVGPPVVLLHGFPDSSALWRHQVKALTAAGWRCIVPDLRGFGQSTKPELVADYRISRSVRDVIGIMDALGVERAPVVGHDWGSGVGWAMATLAPERVERFCAISVGHPTGFWATGMEQRERSWYMLFFQFEGIAEEALSRDGFAFLKDWMGGAGDWERYARDLARPGALTAALNWYRANISPEQFGTAEGPALPPVTCPVLGIWSSGDRHVAEAQMTISERYVTGPWRYERIEGASHWIPVDAPDELNALLLGFLGEPAGDRRGT
jgi:pimeloyl-ACP methyl ester carboxylesterase